MAEKEWVARLSHGAALHGGLTGHFYEPLHCEGCHTRDQMVHWYSFLLNISICSIITRSMLEQPTSIPSMPPSQSLKQPSHPKKPLYYEAKARNIPARHANRVNAKGFA